MYFRVKLQLYIIYTVVRELNKVLRLFLFASHGSIGLQRRQTTYYPPPTTYYYYRRTSVLAELIDIFPTMDELASAPLDNKMSGYDLRLTTYY